MSVATRAKFDKDLRHGEAREDAFVNTVLRPFVECKCDERTRDTGNHAVEFEQRRISDDEVVPSGIAVTKADRWACEFQDDCWLMLPTSLVKEAARRAIREGKTVWAGDENRCHCALVPISWLVQVPGVGK